MKPLTLDDLMPLPVYQQRRDEIRAQTMTHKTSRRISVGPVLSFVFEDRITLRFQVLEMCRVEQISDPAKVQAELDVYNTLMPGPRELSATMFIELTDEEELRRWLPRLPGVEHAIAIRLGPHTVKGLAEGGRSLSDVTSSVHYVRFPFDEEAASAFTRGEHTAELVVDHPSYLASTPIGPDMRASLARDFE